MKKIFIIMAMTMAMIMSQSCKNTPEGLFWQGTIDVVAEGTVEGCFPTGTFAFNGNGSMNVNTSNELLGAEENATVLGLGEALESEDEVVKDAANTINSFFNITKAEGEYHAHFLGYVKYGPLVFHIDEEFPRPVIEVVDTSSPVAPVDTVTTKDASVPVDSK